MKRVLVLFVMLATLSGAGCQGTASPSPPQAFFLEVAEPQDDSFRHAEK